MNQQLANGRQVYGSQLGAAGGREVRALAHHGDTLAAAMYASPPYAVSLPPLGVARLSINLSPACVTGGLDGERSRSFIARRHSLFLTPAGAAATWHKASSSRHINIYFDARAFDHPEDAAWGPMLGAAVPLLNGSLSGAGAMFEMLACELADVNPFGAEAADSLARLILVRLARAPARGGTRANPLTPLLRARLTDFIVTRLDQRLLVADLAGVTGLSPNRFAQAFASAFGQSPHQFVLQLRLERALHLLQHSMQTLADIAATCGFASQQHMTQLMRRRVGTTPARQRAGVAKPQGSAGERALASCG